MEFYLGQQMPHLWHVGDELNKELEVEEGDNGRLKLGAYGEAAAKAVQERLGISKNDVYMSIRTARMFSLEALTPPDQTKALSRGERILSKKHYIELVKITDERVRKLVEKWLAYNWGDEPQSYVLPWYPTPEGREGDAKTHDDLKRARMRWQEQGDADGAGKRKTVRKQAPKYETELGNVMRTLARNPIEAVARINLWMGRIDPGKCDNDEAMLEALELCEQNVARLREVLA